MSNILTIDYGNGNNELHINLDYVSDFIKGKIFEETTNNRFGYIAYYVLDITYEVRETLKNDTLRYDEAIEREERLFFRSLQEAKSALETIVNAIKDLKNNQPQSTTQKEQADE
jgi:hypothetical protein